jgi:hypothetical protein
LTVVFAIGLAPFFALSFYSHPIADDFTYALAVRQLGFWRSQIHGYETC